MKRQIPLGGNILLAATVCIALLAASAHAEVQWAKRIASSTTFPEGPHVGMSLDTNGNCYVTGWFDGTNDFGGVILTNLSVGGSDIFVAKYNSSGALQWAQRAGGSPSNFNYGRGIGVDTNGNVYVTGGYYGPVNFGSINLPASSSENFFLAKYNNAGTVQWVKQGVGGDVYGNGLAVDSAGNSYALAFADNGETITFGSTNVTTPSDFDTNFDASTILVEYDNTGTVKWATVMGGYGETLATAVAVDVAGNVYVTGKFNGNITIGTSNLVFTAGSTENIFIAKFNNSGALTWVLQPTGGNPGTGSVAVDQAGNVYVTSSFAININFGGISLTNAGSSAAFIAKYSSSGAIQWADQAGGSSANLYFDVALDGQSNAYAAGYLNSSAVVAKYDPAGTLQWAYSGGSPPASPLSLVAKCAVDSASNCYLAGWYEGTTTFGTNVLQPQGVLNYFLAKVAAPPPPTLGIVLSNGVPQLSLAGAISSIYSLQWSPKVAATNTPWQTLTTLTLTNSPQFYLDTSVPSRTNRFYRAGPPVLYQSSTSTNPPATSYGMALIPAGSFTLGDTLDGNPTAIPTNVYVSAFYMDTNLVSYSQWQTVYNWATSHGFGFVNTGAGKAANHPVQTVDWFDVVKWSNARSQQAGLTPVYYTDAGWTRVYTNGEVTVYANWAANGYRLPTEAEWEKAARGGLSGQRFSWGNTISESQANYYADTAYYSYDLGPSGHNATFDMGGYPYTSPVGYFGPNGYGLNDMAGNVFEWCWDWYGTPYAGGSDPSGPTTGSVRVLRGGAWDGDTPFEGCAFRYNYGPDPFNASYYIGFRCVRGQLQLQVTTDALPNGTNGSAYSQQLSALYGQLPYSWSLISGSLPAGLALANNGLISGTPTTNGTNNFTVKVTDALSATASQSLTLTVLTVLGFCSPPNGVTPVPNMVWIPCGTFVMGSPTSEAERGSNETQHTVTLTKGFYMGKYAVTQGEYLALLGSNPSYFTTQDFYGNPIPPDLNRPAEQVSWYDATDYCARLTAQEQAAGMLPVGWVYRLPTESEREYACRAGTMTAFHYGNALHGGMANFYDYYEYDASIGDIIVTNPAVPVLGRTTMVGSYQPNAWGLYDMHGNVWEWCRDWYGTYPTGSVTDPQGPSSGSFRVVRGGSWYGDAFGCRSAQRGGGDPSRGYFYVGFRIVLAPDQP